MLSAVINHLWQSTIFAVGVGGLTLMLRRNSARIRYGLWFSASVKFLLPFALLSALGSHIPRAQPNLAMNTGGAQAISMAIDRIAAPMPARDQMTGAARPSAGAMQFWVHLLEGVWACGALGIASYWSAGWVGIRRIRNASTPISMDFPIPVRRSATMQEPAVAGIVRPILLVPDGLEDWLSTAQLRAVLAHERCHVRRRDNLTAAVHMVVEGLFWFHPLVWWLETRLIAERERACDEEVLAEGNSAHSYAEGIVRVCQHYLDSPLRCVAGVGGGNLAKRIDSILNSHRRMRLSALQAVLLAGIASAVVAEPIISGHLEAPNRSADGGATAVDPHWEAAVRLPQQILANLKGSDDPGDQEMVQRNSQLWRAGVADAWGIATQEQIVQFFAGRSFATRPEAVGARMAIACREIQCQIQISTPSPPIFGEEAQSSRVIDDLRRQPWYQTELVMTVGVVTSANDRQYQLQYFDRKSSPFDNSVLQAPVATTGSKLASGRAVSPQTAFPSDIYQLMVDQLKAYPAASRQLASLAHAHGMVAGAEDDPEWARPMERRMREAISADPAAERMDVRAIACRKSGCEIQWVESHPAAKLAELPPWTQVVEHLRKSDLGTAIEMDKNFSSKYGDSVMYVTTFKRKGDSSDAPP